MLTITVIACGPTAETLRPTVRQTVASMSALIASQRSISDFFAADNVENVWKLVMSMKLNSDQST